MNKIIATFLTVLFLSAPAFAATVAKKPAAKIKAVIETPAAKKARLVNGLRDEHKRQIAKHAKKAEVKAVVTKAAKSK